MKYAILASGSKGNATLIQLGDFKLIIDVGISFLALKRLLNELNLTPDDIDYFFITHEHSDHIKGIKQIESEKVIVPDGLPGYSNYLKPNSIYKYDDIEITTFSTFHDSKVGLGFLFEYQGVRLGYFTDTGYFPDTYLNSFSDCDYFIFESNHDEQLLLNCQRPHFVKMRILSDLGHLSNRDSAIALSKLIGPRTKEVTLAHLSEQANTEELALETHLRIYSDYDINIESIKLRCARQNGIILGGEWENGD